MSGFFWCIEYIASFIEILMCCYFCATFIAKEVLENVKNKLLIYSTLISILIFAMNHNVLFSDFTTWFILVVCIAIDSVREFIFKKLKLKKILEKLERKLLK